MTKERLRYLINICKHREGSETQHYERVARHLGVGAITLRRWLHGETPVPRQVEIIMTIYHLWPEVTAEAVDKVIQAHDEGSRT